jgi:squalene-associated FAD-dependent desaturase
VETAALKADVVVIGAGFAGLSAAVRLVDAGRRVVVVEEAPRLGGRATAFTDRETGERVDNGQHVLFGCYRETYAFLRRLGTDTLAPLQRRLSLTMIGPHGERSQLECPDWRPPWHLAGGVLRWRAMPLSDRLTAVRLMRLLGDVRREGAAAVAARVPAEQTVSQWLEAQGQSISLSDWLWRPLAIAALNQSPDEAAAAPFVRVLGELFGPRVEDSAIGMASVPLDELYAEPARRVVEAAGGAVLQKSPARIRIGLDGGIESVDAASVRIEARAVISTVPWHALGRIWTDGAPTSMQPLIANATALGSSPIVTVNFWFDERVMSEPFVGLVGGPMHWVFDKSAIFTTVGGHLSIVASGAVGLAALDNAAITAAARGQLEQALPATAKVRLVRTVVVREQRATFSLAPGSPPRPAAETPIRGFYLAGDWTDTGLPGTIEGAVRSGHTAADLVIRDREVVKL